MNDTLDRNYVKGFNEGYLIAAHIPSLSDQLAKIDSTTSRIAGIKDGGKQFAIEQVKDFLPSWSQASSASVKSKGKIIDNEPDIEQ